MFSGDLRQQDGYQAKRSPILSGGCRTVIELGGWLH